MAEAEWNSRQQYFVGGSPAATIGNPAVLMGDTYFTMNYRKIGGTWAGWTSPVLVEGWIKRVLAKINPFNQRMSDLANSAAIPMSAC